MKNICGVILIVCLFLNASKSDDKRESLSNIKELISSQNNKNSTAKLQEEKVVLLSYK